MTLEARASPNCRILECVHHMEGRWEGKKDGSRGIEASYIWSSGSRSPLRLFASCRCGGSRALWCQTLNVFRGS